MIVDLYKIDELTMWSHRWIAPRMLKKTVLFVRRS